MGTRVLGGAHMSIASGYTQMKNYFKESGTFKLISRWTSANTVECDDGKTVQEKIGKINGISSSFSSNDSSQAASTALTNQLHNDIESMSGNIKFPDGAGFYPDVKNGVRGYNTDPARGADTFNPFRPELNLSQCLIQSNISSSTAIYMGNYCDDITAIGLDDFLLVVTSIDAYCTSWGHPSDTHGPATSNSFSPVVGSYNNQTGVLTVSISTPTYGSGTYGQTGGGNCKLTPHVDVYFLGRK